MKKNDVVEALIEIPMGSQNKYEVDKDSGRIKLDRVLYAPIFYPAEYGYIENTLAGDGDPIDILVFTSYPTFPGCLINARIIGMLDMIDGGKPDVKLIAVCQDDPRYGHVKSFSDFNPHILIEVEHFFKTYKTLQGNVTEVFGWKGYDAAMRELEEAHALYDKVNND